MRYIDMESWPRRHLFAFFDGKSNPHFSVCANVDLTDFYPAVKRHGFSFTAAVVYVLAHAANTVPEFRQRIRNNNQVVEHEIVHPGFTVLSEGDVFSFCHVDYSADFSVFAAQVVARIAYVKAHPSLDENPAREDDVLYMTAIPWVSFTGLMHTFDLKTVDSVPRLAWGKYFKDGERLKMPLSVQAHHALVDGVHAGRYYEAVQELLDHPDSVLGKV